MLNISNVFVKYGDRVLLNNINATIRPGERVGLIGRNGAGKSTLLKLMNSDVSPHSGNIEVPKEMTIGYLKQVLDFQRDHTVMEEALLAFEEFKLLQEKLDKLNKEIAVREDYESESYSNLIQDISDCTEQLYMEEIENPEAQASRILKGLGFKEHELSQPLKTFSGGWLMRVEMAKLLLMNPDLLLLDEPTNHLDIESIVWMESYLKTYQGIIILISHDKSFLDNVTNRTIEIELGRLIDIKVNYSKFMVEKESISEITKSAHLNQQKEIAHKEKLIEKFRAKANKAKLAQSLIKQLDKMEKVEVLGEDTKVMRIKFPEPPRSGREVVNISNLYKSYGDNRVLENVNLVVERGERVAFVGQNGQGKSTLAKIITKNIVFDKGDLRLNENVFQGYYSQDHHETLDEKVTLYDTLYGHTPPELKTKVRTILGSFLFSGEDIDKKVTVLSGGERARLALACLVVNPTNLLILDEPTNHLDILSKETLKQAILDYKGTLIVVSHDRDFLSGLTDKTYEFANQNIKEYLGDIQYFLDKKQADNFRQVEQDYNKKEKTVKSDKKPIPTQSINQIKEIEKSIKKKEREIKEAESSIAKMEIKMAEDNFYQSEGSEKLISKYNGEKSKLSKLEEEWETLVDKMAN